MTGEQRMAENEILFREVNERILEIDAHKSHVDRPIDFMCERVVETHPTYLVVEKLPPTPEAAVEADPRA